MQRNCSWTATKTLIQKNNFQKNVRKKKAVRRKLLLQESF